MTGVRKAPMGCKVDFAASVNVIAPRHLLANEWWEGIVWRQIATLVRFSGGNALDSAMHTGEKELTQMPPGGKDARDQAQTTRSQT